MLDVTGTLPAAFIIQAGAVSLCQAVDARYMCHLGLLTAPL